MPRPTRGAPYKNVGARRRPTLWLCRESPRAGLHRPAFAHCARRSALRRRTRTVNESLPLGNHLLPIQRAPGLVFDYARLEEVALLLEVDHLAHPRERIRCPD